jgi:hypothetical protein
MDHDPHCDLLYELRDVPVGIGQMAGSHFTTLKTLGEVLPKEHIKTVHTGGPGQRLVALQVGKFRQPISLTPRSLSRKREGCVSWCRASS